MGMLSGNEIERCVRSGEIEITPFKEEQVNPHSYDMRLGETLLVYDTKQGYFDLESREWEGPEPETYHIKERRGYLLRPGDFVLGHTIERLYAPHHAALVDGKSSIGRMSLSIHTTAGYVDTGFSGQITLELSTTAPIVLRPGVRMCQVSFHTIVGSIRPYTGRYQGSVGVIPVR